MQIKKKSQKQEKQTAKDFNAKTVVASGALWGSKGDVRSNNYLIECKTTSKNFYSLSVNVWEKIKKEAIKDGLRTPLMCIDLCDGAYSYIVMEDKDVPMRDEIHRVLGVYSTRDVGSSKSFRVQAPTSSPLLDPSLRVCITPFGKFAIMRKSDVIKYFKEE